MPEWWKKILQARPNNILPEPRSLNDTFLIPALSVKLILQYILGATIFISAILYIVTAAYLFTWLEIDFLWLIGRILLVSAGVELAYMLFTEGPDEALDPLLLGLSATSLLLIAKLKDAKIENYFHIFFGAMGVFALVVAICLLVYMRQYLQRHNRKDQEEMKKSETPGRIQRPG